MAVYPYFNDPGFEAIAERLGPALGAKDDLSLGNYGFRYTIKINPLHKFWDQQFNDSPIPYSLMAGPTFQCSEQGHSCTEVYVIKAQDYGRFCCVVLPSPFPLGKTHDWPGTIPLNRVLPGNPLFNLKSVTAEPLDGGMVDPYETDPWSVPNSTLIQEWLNTYTPLMRVTLTYEYDFLLSERANVGAFFLPEDPSTYTEHSYDIGGEFINVGPSKVQQIPVSVFTTGHTQVNVAIENIREVCDPNNHDYQPPNVDQAVAVTDRTIALRNTIPLIEHTLTWNDVWDPPFCAMQIALGKVNRNSLPWLNNATPETVLFIGAAIRRQNNIAANGFRLWTVEYRFAERRITIPLEDEVPNEDPPIPLVGVAILGWNHAWVPDAKQWGHILLRVEDVDPGDPADPPVAGVEGSLRSLYLNFDFANLFKRDNFKAGSLHLPLGQNVERGVQPYNPHPCDYLDASPGGAPGTVV